MPSISIVDNYNVNPTRSDVLVKVVGLTDTATEPYWTNWGTTSTPRYENIFLAINGSGGFVSKGTARGESTTRAFTLLTPGQSYTVQATINYLTTSGSSGTNTSTALSFTAAEYVPPTPTAWYWSPGIVSGAETTVLTAAEWNEFLAWLGTACEYAGVASGNLWTERSGNPILASHVGNVVEAVNRILAKYGGGSFAVPSAGEPVKVSLFTQMSSRVNSALGVG